jgi:hypothetical protein
MLEHLDYSREEVEEAFRLLKDKEGVIQPVVEYEGELRYVIIDKKLSEFIMDCALFSNSVMLKMQNIWSYIRKPTPDEIKWLESFQGRKGSDAIRTRMYNIRHAIPRTEKKYYVKEAKNEIKSIDNGITKDIQNLKFKYAEVMKKYSFSSDDLLEMVYPKFIEKSIV